MADNIFLNLTPESINYTSTRSGGRPSTRPERSRIQHAQKLKSELENIWKEVKRNHDKRLAVQKSVKEGTYLEFVGEPGFPLTIKSLENRNTGIKLLNVRKYKRGIGEGAEAESENTDNELIKATVFIPKGKEQFFLDRIVKYQNEDTAKEKPKHQNLVETISSIKLAVLEAFWTSKSKYLPGNELVWCELWFHDDSGEGGYINVEREIRIRLKQLHIESRKETLKFPERKVILIKVNYNQLTELIASIDYIAEIRRATEVNTFFTELENKEQIEWANDLKERIVNEDTNVAVSILDTGLNNGNMLLNIIPDSNIHSYFEDTGNDNQGHGSRMAGVSLYGDLKELLESTEEITLSHTLESMKILPDVGENDPELYGYITADSISHLYIKNPNINRVITMAVSTEDYMDMDGRPSSWSAAIDNTTAGAVDEIYKLFLVSAGNVKGPEERSKYPDINLVKQIENPGQSWNAITVGAYTNLDKTDPKYNVLAKKGGLSPFSRTSMLFDKVWPIKPEIVLEGGNAVIDGSIAAYEDENLSSLTTYHDPTDAVFTHINATSAATASAGWMAAKIQAKYPNAWPETIRALLIHSAEWTEEMKKQFLKGNKKGAYQELLRTCGYGVPSLQRAVETVNNRINLIIQSELQPYVKIGSNFKTKDMHLYQLPWPKDVLEEIYDKDVKLKVTLSYFIEPGPGEKGWQDKYRYASTGLRFELNGSSDRESFVKRINKAVRETEESAIEENSVKWVLGTNNRDVGSIHSDTWIGSGAELATSNYIGIYPVIGWWRERSHIGKWHKKVRYSLIVSLEAPNLDVDLLTPVLTEIETRVDTPIEIDF